MSTSVIAGKRGHSPITAHNTRRSRVCILLAEVINVAAQYCRPVGGGQQITVARPTHSETEQVAELHEKLTASVESWINSALQLGW